MATRTARSKKQRDDGGVKFSRAARADLFEALPLIRSDLAGKIPPVHRREDRLPKGKSRAGRPLDPEIAFRRFFFEFMAWGKFEAARDLRDASDVASREGKTAHAVLCRSMSYEEASATAKIGLAVLKRASLLQPRRGSRRRTLSDEALRQACGLTARYRPTIQRSSDGTPFEFESTSATNVRLLRDLMRQEGLPRGAFGPEIRK